jgi:TRAP-type C4-dicarboxylate transport system permease small subunit
MIARTLARLAQAAQLAVSLLFAGVFAIFIYKIFMRYVFDQPIPWADELSVVLFVWVIFCANALVVSDRQQITFDLVYHLLPQWGQRGAALLRTVIVGGLFIAALPTVIGYIRFLWREHTAVLMLPLDYVYSCFGLFVFMVGVRAILAFIGLVGPRWREYL